jgi:hypothetical protein
MMLYDCLIKTKHFAKTISLSIECEACPMSAGQIYIYLFIYIGTPDQWRPYL